MVLPSGKVIGDSDANPERHGQPRRSRRKSSKRSAATVGRSQIVTAPPMQEDRIYVAVPLMHGDAPIAVVRTSLPVTALTRTLEPAFATGSSLPALIGMLLLRGDQPGDFPPHEPAAWRRSRPGPSDLPPAIWAIGCGSPDSAEIAALAETMNRMAEQLDERIQTVLRQQNEREAMLSSMEEGVLAINNEGTILSLNKACATLLGEEPAKLQGRGIYEVIRKADLLKFIESALASASPVEGEIQIRGTQDRWVSAHGTVLHDSQRGKIGVLIVLHDITRLRHLEEVRRDFVANVSHELRTPITSIKGFHRNPRGRRVRGQGKRPSLPADHAAAGESARRHHRRPADAVAHRDAAPRNSGSNWRRSRSAAVLQAAIEMCEKKAADKAVKIELVCPEDLDRRDQRGAAGAGRGQSSGQRHQVQQRRGGRRGSRRLRGGGACDSRQGPGLRHRGPALAAAVRAVLPRRQGPQPRIGRHRAWGWRSSGTSPWPIAARSASRARSASAARSACGCRMSGEGNGGRTASLAYMSTFHGNEPVGAEMSSVLHQSTVEQLRNEQPDLAIGQQRRYFHRPAV